MIWPATHLHYHHHCLIHFPKEHKLQHHCLTCFPKDAPAVPTAAYIPWGSISGNDVAAYIPWESISGNDSGVGGWPDHDEPAAMGQADVPTASKPNTFLEAACKGFIAEEVLLCCPHAALR